MVILTREDVRRAATMPEIMAAMAAAFAQLSSGQADVPLRPHIAIPEQEATALVMPAYLRGDGSLGVKLLTLFPHNPAQGLPAIAALVALFDSANGQPLALIDGGLLTALRTGAASGGGGPPNGGGPPPNPSRVATPERWRSSAREDRRSRRSGPSVSRARSSVSGW
jgi:ornithine cyclodeaminase/alanine dehydrogenase-like protein (mu-crystallin family)